MTTEARGQHLLDRQFLAPEPGSTSSIRAVLYARYSSDLQSASSIEDQIRLCREWLEREAGAGVPGPSQVLPTALDGYSDSIDTSFLD